MPRRARKKSKTGIYHVMVRGINRQKIFKDNGDYAHFIETIRKTKEKSEFKIYGYCLMGNHVHLLLQERKESISLSMQRICSSFVYWYNRKYDRLGHLFQERYKSEVVENDAYLITVLRYIHQNPIKAGITKLAAEYEWSSYHEYMQEEKMIDTDFILGLFSTKKKFKEYTDEVNMDTCLDDEERHRISDEKLFTLIEERHGVKRDRFHLLEGRQKDIIIKDLKTISGVTIRQLARVVGVSKYKVENV